jgi:WD40 repeat protein
VFVFDTRTGEELRQLPVRSAFGGLALAPDDDQLAAVERDPGRADASRTQTLKLLSLSTGEIAREIALPAGHTTRVAFSADGACLAVAVRDTEWSAHVYDTASGRELAAIATQDNEVRALAFSPDGGGLATALADTTVIVWDVAHFRTAD